MTAQMIDADEDEKIIELTIIPIGGLFQILDAIGTDDGVALWHAQCFLDWKDQVDNDAHARSTCACCDGAVSPLRFGLFLIIKISDSDGRYGAVCQRCAETKDPSEIRNEIWHTLNEHLDVEMHTIQ